MAQAMTANLSEGRRQALERRRTQATQGRAGLPVRAAGGQSAAKTSPAAPTPHTPAAAPRQGQRPLSSGAASTGRTASVARRRAMASQGKRGIAVAADAQRTPADAMPARLTEPKADKDCGCGCREEEGTVGAEGLADGSGAPLSIMARPSAKAKTAGPRRSIGQPEGRQLSKARRRMLAEKGRSAVNQTERVRSPAERARHLNPDLNGRELAKETRSERSRSGGRGQKSSAPCGRQRPAAGGAQDAPWKVGSSETAKGQAVTGTLVGRSRRMTGDEPSTCRPITGTEYLGADIFREFCQSEMMPGPSKVSATKTAAGRAVTGTEVGRSTKVTGNEAGNCKRVTGNEYLPAGQVSDFCGDAPAAVPSKITVTRTGGGRAVSGSNVDRPSRVTGTEAGAERETTGTPYITAERAGGGDSVFKKVGLTSTLRGGQVTGTMVGRSTRVTGDEPSTCRQITGDEYIGSEQYEAFCRERPRPEAPKIGLSQTNKGKVVTGTQTGRGLRVTGDEPGTCKAVTGTPYTGLETYREYCAPEAARDAAARGRVGRATPGLALTGLQPGIGGKMTGDHRGACEAITGTPYIGQDQYGQHCGGLGAVPGNPDFPQSLDGTPWQATFSVNTPARDAQRARRLSGITGTRYEQGHITGPFGMGEGKITGTEEFRFGGGDNAVPVPAQPGPITAPRTNVTGEGMETGLRITGDDWGRNERVTGTEGRSAIQRNPTRRGSGMGGLAIMRRALEEKKPVEAAPSRVTGSSGNTDKGALITVSGGARG